MAGQKTENNSLISNLIYLLVKGNAHASLDDALKNIPFEILNKKPAGLPYNIWQLAEHIRISQSDILEFSRNPNHQSPKWPEGYWPSSPTVTTKEEWQNCIEKIILDRESFIDVLNKSQEDLYRPFTYGDGQTLLRETLVLADHNSYHTGEIIVL
ncbi:MAG: DinB family protein, partial [Ginsengibacter sp.]